MSDIKDAVGAIIQYVRRISEEAELKPDSTCAFFAQVQTEGKRQ